MTTDSSAYTLEYNAFGNISKIKAGANTLATYTYGSYNGKLQRLTYGNGYYEEYTYDRLDRIKQIKYNGDGTKTYTLTYSGDGGVYSITDTVAGIKYIYEYDSLGRLIRGEQKKTGDNSSLIFAENEFDNRGRAYKSTYLLGSKTLAYEIDYITYSNLVSSYKLPDGKYNTYTYDAFDRLTMKKYHNLAYYSQYRYYEPTSTSTSSLVSLQYNNYNGGTSKYDYTYDILGNITSVSENNVLKLSYEYDSLGQLVRENNAYANKTWKYYYDNAGNIVYKDEYAYTTGTLPASPQSFVLYDYSTGAWGDQLTAYDGTTISYDAIGNPTKWRNATSLTWDGRKLTRQDISSTSSVTYGYNADGIRVSRSYNSSSERLSRSYQYILDGTNVIYEKQQTVAQFGGSTDELYYHYDESGVAGFELNGVTYYYLKNIQGDVINILNSSGQVVVTYTYDAWGKVLSVTGSLASTVGQINPFRYRGYYYDTETGFYYLQTRYYDPEVGRFLNADVYVSTGQGIIGNNMFAYCNNNPVLFLDVFGDIPHVSSLLTDSGELDGQNAAIIRQIEAAAQKQSFKEYMYGSTLGTFVYNMHEDISYFKLVNTDEQRVLNAHYFSCYKGVPAIVNLPIGGNAFSFGMMFFGDTEQIHEQDVRHEYGHSVHFLQIGATNYTLFVAIPSLYGYWTDVPYEEYYSQPWEYIADQLGGVQRTGYNYSADAKSNAARWWRISKNPLLALIQELLY